MAYPNHFEKLINSFKKLPGIGTKGAERMAFHILSMDPSLVETFSKALIETIELTRYCEICGNITEQAHCDICRDPQRDQSKILIVENPKDIYAVEKSSSFDGVYHVLNGNINILEGILAEDLNIDPLFDRLNDSVKEIIIATNPTRDGETTALYLAKLLEGKDLKVTRIAHGLPIGGNLDYADQLTLIKALEGRRQMK